MTAHADTNLFVRVLANDNPEMSAQAISLFQRVERNEAWLLVSPEVVAEVVYVFQSPKVYNLPRPEITERLLVLLKLAGIRLAERQTVEHALAFYASSKIDFVDCLLIARARLGKVKKVCSFDPDYRSIPGVDWVLPA